MNLTTRQRRMAAAALRSLGRTTMPVVAIVGTVADAYGGRPDASPVEALADLVDWPTCHDVADFDRESFKCSRCGFRVLSIDGAPDAAKLVGTKGGVAGFGYCPNCGAEVVDA